LSRPTDQSITKICCAAYAAQGHEQYYSKVAECVPDAEAREAIADGVKQLHARYWKQLLGSVETFGKWMAHMQTLAMVHDSRPVAANDSTAADARIQALLEENGALAQRSEGLAQDLAACEAQEESLRASLAALEPRSGLGRTLGDPKVVERLVALAEDARVASRVIAQCEGWLATEGTQRGAAAGGSAAGEGSAPLAMRIKPGLTASEMQACLDAMQSGL
jgi:hypothetical protein